MTTIFISHSSSEARLAKYFAIWIEQAFPNARCFCSSRPADLPPGADWSKNISEQARNSGLCLLLLSPDSVGNNWIHFEAGLVTGAGINKKTVPVLFGGMNVSSIPSTLHYLQALILNDSDSFNAFVSSQFIAGATPASNQNYHSFIAGCDSSTSRLLRFGAFGLWAPENTKTEVFNSISLDNKSGSIILPAINEEGRLIAIRSKIIPRRQGSMQHWKFGIELRAQNDQEKNSRLFQFHAGCHSGLSSWTLYFSPTPHVPINQSAALFTESISTLQLWLSRDGWSAGCVGTDCQGQRSILRNDRGNEVWRIANNKWSQAIISGWADGAPFQIDI